MNRNVIMKIKIFDDGKMKKLLKWKNITCKNKHTKKYQKNNVVKVKYLK